MARNARSMEITSKRTAFLIRLFLMNHDMTRYNATGSHITEKDLKTSTLNSERQILMARIPAPKTILKNIPEEERIEHTEKKIIIKMRNKEAANIIISVLFFIK